MGGEIGDLTDAKKDVISSDDELRRILKGVHTVEIVKGKQILRFDLRQQAFNDELKAAMTGPTGNLRAPTLRRGKKLLVGFNEAMYEAACGD